MAADYLTNLTAWWRFGSVNPAFGGAVLTNNNGVTFGTSGAKMRMAGTFVTGSSQSLSSTDSLFDIGTNDFSSAGWVYPGTNLPTGNGGRVIQQRGTGALGSNPGWQFVLSASTGNAVVTNTAFDDGSSGVNPWLTTVLGTLDAWYHVAMTFDRSGNALLYRNGSVVGTTSISGVTGSLNTARAFTFGASDVTATQYFDGKLENWGLWIGRVLDTDTIAGLYNGGVGFDPLQRRYNRNELSGGLQTMAGSLSC